MFFKVTPSEEVFSILDNFPRMDEEEIPIEDAYQRVISTDIIAPCDLPDFSRSTMDGFAVNSRDTFGATEGLPSLLEVVGEVPMGYAPKFELRDGQCAKIWTGGMLPKGADSVVMIEHTSMIDESTVEVYKSVAPLENVIQPGDDFEKGDMVMKKGTALMPQDVGTLASFGIEKVKVYKRPKVAVISTGDEIVPISYSPTPGKIRDINTYSLCAFAKKYNSEPIIMGICSDDETELKQKLKDALKRADAVFISGGSSVGKRDITIKVFESFENIDVLVHGISISPGKPTIIAKTSDGRGVFGLPGHTASALVVAEVFLSYFLLRISGQDPKPQRIHTKIKAELDRNVDSSGGRDDFIRVKITRTGDRFMASPVFGKSGLISTLVQGDGLVHIDRNTEGLYRGQTVEVILLRALI